MAELRLDIEPDEFRDDWLVIGGDKFRLRADIPLYAVEDYFAPGRMTVERQLAFVRAVIAGKDQDRFTEAIRKARLSRKRAQEMVDFLAGVYSGRPPERSASSKPGGERTGTGSQENSSSAEPTLTSSEPSDTGTESTPRTRTRSAKPRAAR